MKEFLFKLASGKLLKKDVPKDRLDMVDMLAEIKVLSVDNKFLYLKSDFKIGEIDITRDGTGYLSVFGSNDKDLLVESYNLSGATKGDIVLVKRLFKKRGRPSAKVIATLEPKNLFTLCFLEQDGKHIKAYDLKTQNSIPIAIKQKALKKLPPKSVIKVDNRDGDILEVLGVLSDPKVDYKISLALYEKRDEFQKEAEIEAKSYGNFVDKSQYPDRVDLTHLPFCTIDPKDAKDHDDAIYFDKENFILYVAIADVSYYVNEFSSIDKEASFRGFSIYFPHKSVPMLPRALSENICSLKDGVDRLSYIYKAKLHRRTLKPTKEEFFEGIIKSVRKYSYDSADLFLEQKKVKTDTIDTEVLKWLMPLFEVTKKLREFRLKKGYDFINSETKLILDEDEKLINVELETSQTASHSLIEECMLLANKGAANSIEKGIYRVHEEIDPSKIDDMLNKMAEFSIFPKKTKSTHALILSIQKEADKLDIREMVDRIIIKSLKQARYSNINIGHFGLGFDNYSHFTSPIRRYSDLILHRLLKASFGDDKKRLSYLLNNLESKTEVISDLEREATKVEWDFKDRKYARWAEENIGQIIEATVVDEDKMPFAKVDTQIIGARIFLPRAKVKNLDRILVEITQSDIASTRIYGKVIEFLD